MFLHTENQTAPIYSSRWVREIGDLPVLTGHQTIVLHCYQCEHCDRVAKVRGEAKERFFCRDCNHLIGIDKLCP